MEKNLRALVVESQGHRDVHGDGIAIQHRGAVFPAAHCIDGSLPQHGTTNPAGLMEACNTTLPVIPADFATEGYIGITEKISAGDLTSPPTFTRTGGGGGGAILAADDIC
jgi:hypothetical protein